MVKVSDLGVMPGVGGTCSEQEATACQLASGQDHGQLPLGLPGKPGSKKLYLGVNYEIQRWCLG